MTGHRLDGLLSPFLGGKTSWIADCQCGWRSEPQPTISAANAFHVRHVQDMESVAAVPNPRPPL